MKLAVVSIYPLKGERHGQSGGVASYTKNLAQNLRKYAEEDELFVICDQVEGRVAYKEHGINVRRVFNRSPRFVSQVWAEIETVRPDVVHIQQELSLYGGPLTAVLLRRLVRKCRRAGINTIVTLHGVVPLSLVDSDFVTRNNSRLPAWFVRQALKYIYVPIARAATTVIVHEAYFRQVLRDDYGIDEAKVKVIHHGIEQLDAISRAEACEQLGLAPQKKYVLFMGYATGYKGIDKLIKGFGRFAKANPDVVLLLGAGAHPKLVDDQAYQKKYAQLKKLARKHIDEANYQWCGFIKEEDIVTFYCAADVSVYPYTIQMSSSGPMAFAMSLDKPILVSDAFKQVITDSDMRFSGDPQSIATALEKFFAGSLPAHDYQRQQRLWPAVAQQTYELYHRPATVLFLRKDWSPHTGFSKHIVRANQLTDARKIIVADVIHASQTEIEQVQAEGFEIMTKASLQALLAVRPTYVEVHGGLLTIFTWRRYRQLFKLTPVVVYIHSSKFRLRDLRSLKFSDTLRETRYTIDGAFLFNALLPMWLYTWLLKLMVVPNRTLIAMASQTQVQRYGQLLERVGFQGVHIPSGADMTQISERKQPSNTPVVASFSRAQLVRGLDVLIETAGHLPELKFKLYLLPDSASRVLKVLARQHDNVTLKEGKADMKEVLRQADVFVFLVRSMRAIPFQPLTIIEALNTGKPVIAANIPPVAELAASYDNLTLVDDFKNPAQVAQCIKTVVAANQSTTIEQVPAAYDWQAIDQRQQTAIKRILQ